MGPGLRHGAGDGQPAVAGDAARLIDPLTGAGIQNALLSGRLAGEAAARAVREGDASGERLASYDRAWRSRLEEDLARHYLVKEGLQKLDDAAIDRVFHAIAEADLRPLTVPSVLDVLRARTPEVLPAFEGLGF